MVRVLLWAHSVTKSSFKQTNLVVRVTDCLNRAETFFQFSKLETSFCAFRKKKKECHKFCVTSKSNEGYLGLMGGGDHKQTTTVCYATVHSSSTFFIILSSFSLSIDLSQSWKFLLFKYSQAETIQRPLCQGYFRRFPVCDNKLNVLGILLFPWIRQ